MMCAAVSESPADPRDQAVAMMVMAGKDQEGKRRACVEDRTMKSVYLDRKWETRESPRRGPQLEGADHLTQPVLAPRP